MSKCIRRWKNSLAVCIPKAFAEKIGMQANDELELTLLDGQVVLALGNTSAPLGKMVKSVTEEIHHTELIVRAQKGTHSDNRTD